MPLRLILGPSGARKVGGLLDAHEEASRGGATAWFVVPSGADVEPFQRELAGLDGPPGVPRRDGVPFGAVMSEAQLQRRLLSRFGTGQQLLSREHRRAVALAAIHETAASPHTQLTALAPAQRSGWLDEALVRLADELVVSGDLGGPAEEGLRGWAAHSSDRRGLELADLLEADAALLARLASPSAAVRHVDRARAAEIVASALDVAPSAAADLHVVFAGFDDLDAVQRRLVLALGRSAAQVLVSLPFEEGREAVAAARPLVDELRAAASQTSELLAGERGRAVAALEQLGARLYEHDVFVAPPSEPEPDPFAPLVQQGGARLGPLVDYDAVDAEAAAEGDPAQGRAVVGPAEGGTRATTSSSDAADAPVVELRGGGPDEEAALIAEHVREQLRRGVAPERIAVVVGSPDAGGPALEAALSRAGVRAHLVAQRPASVWPSVAAVVALLRAVGESGEARHLVDWVGGPGGPGARDAFDAAVRRAGATTIRDGLRIWARLGNERMGELDELWSAARQRNRDRLASDALTDDAAVPTPPAGEAASLEAVVARVLRARLASALAAVRGRPTPDEERDFRAVGAVLSVLDGLVQLGQQAPELGLGLTELVTLIERARAPKDVEPEASVAVLSPLDVRTRYPEVVVIARAVHGTYPAAEPIRQLLTRSDRAALRAHHGWPAPARPEHAASERYLAYEVVSRPTRQLVIAWHAGNGDGKPLEPSPLLDELRRVAPEPLAQVSLPAGAAARRAMTAARQTRLEAARAGVRHREPVPDHSPLLAAQPRDRYAVGELQTASRCGAQWFVSHLLRPQPLSPDAAPLTAGRLRHDILHHVVRGAVTGGAVLGPAAIPALRAELAAAAERLEARGVEQRETQAERLMRDRVVAEVDATIPGLCGEGPLAHQPLDFEVPFGTGPGPAGEPEPGSEPEAAEADDVRPPVTVERAGERLVLAGRIDRIDRNPQTGELVVIDYKGANVDAFKGASWLEGRELQAGLYALAAEELVGDGSRTVASLYQPVPGPANQPPRGATSTDLPGRAGLRANDELDRDAWDELLDALVGLAADAQRAIDDGAVRPEPTRCSPRGCRYPWLCREVQG